MQTEKKRVTIAFLLLVFITSVVTAQDTESSHWPTEMAGVQDVSVVMTTDTPADTVATMPATSETELVLWPRTNLLLPLFNVGIEFPIGNRFSVGADWYYPWIPRSYSHKNCFQALGLELEARYWLGRSHGSGQANRKNRLLGHSIGAFVMSGNYDLGRNYSGHQGDFVLGGVDYLYAMPILQGKARLELSLGVGYFYSKATHYEVYGWNGRGYRDKDFRKIFEYVGPLKANVTIVVPIRVPWNKTADR